MTAGGEFRWKRKRENRTLLLARARESREGVRKIIGRTTVHFPLNRKEHVGQYLSTPHGTLSCSLTLKRWRQLADYFLLPMWDRQLTTASKVCGTRKEEIQVTASPGGNMKHFFTIFFGMFPPLGEAVLVISSLRFPQTGCYISCLSKSLDFLTTALMSRLLFPERARREQSAGGDIISHFCYLWSLHFPVEIRRDKIQKLRLDVRSTWDS